MARRRIVKGLASTLLAAVFEPGIARAQRALGKVYDGVPVDKPGPGLEPVVNGSGFARLGVELAAADPAIFSIANANDCYAGLVELPKVPARASYITVSGGVVCARGWGTGFSGRLVGEANFEVDRALADELAKIWSVPRRDRTPIGTGVVGHFRPRAPLVVGAPMEIVLGVRNHGADAVGFLVGGRQRGPRDNRFAFVVQQNGKPLPVIQAYDFGGLMSYRELKPGDALEVSADLASWVKIDSPGDCRVTCSYNTELVPAGTRPDWPDHGHEKWDLKVSETLDVTVG